MATNQAPTSAIFSIVEILETILLPLDFHDLLHAMATCKTFHDVITGSIGLRKTLWLHPADAEEVVGTRLGGLRGPNARQYLSLDASNAQKGDLVVAALNPSFRHAFPITSPKYHPSLKLLARIRYEVNIERLLTFAEQDSPWLQMYVFQPPPTKMLVQCYEALEACDGPSQEWHHECGKQSLALKITNDGGVRLANIVNSMKKFTAIQERKYEAAYGKQRFASTNMLLTSSNTNDDEVWGHFGAPWAPFRVCKTHITLNVNGYLLDFSTTTQKARMYSKYCKPAVDKGPEPICISDDDEDEAQDARGKQQKKLGKVGDTEPDLNGDLPWVKRGFRFEVLRAPKWSLVL